MAIRFKRRSKKKGLPPGTIVHTGESKKVKPKITVIDYDEGSFQEKTVAKVEDCYKFRKTKTRTWINIDGVHDVGILEKIGSHFGVHPLVMEDIANVEQRPKFEDFGDYLYIVMRMFYNGQGDEVKSEQISFVVGDNFVISFQETEGDMFGPIRERIRNGKGAIRKMGTDYLVYSLIDAIVDNYFVILEKLGETIETLEEELTLSPTNETLQKIHRMKREMIYLRKGVWPLREVINTMSRSESELIRPTTVRYLRDVYDHTIQVIDTVETYRDILSGMVDLYLSSISNKMNEIMKVLTIIATIFIPLTFITGVYGMNFHFMPELEWELGYPFAWGSMALVAIIMIGYFKKKKWI